MSITVYAHVTKATEVTVKLQETEVGKTVVLSTDELFLIINSREKMLEITSLLETAAQKWDEEKQ